MSFHGPVSAASSDDEPNSVEARADPRYSEYIDFFEEVFRTMAEHYYLPLDRKDFERFLEDFDERIYQQVRSENPSPRYVKWRTAAHLVDFLKDPKDVFSAFMPPKAAKHYETEVLGKRIDLGIEGRRVPQGYLVTMVEPRSDAYREGLRRGDLLLFIEDADTRTLDERKIADLLTPIAGARVTLGYVPRGREEVRRIVVTSREYFKQTVFLVPVGDPRIFCLKITRFNRKTAEDMTRFMNHILDRGGRELILDLRGNPGGPPLAAREISAFFLAPRSPFAYFQKRGRPPAVLFVPEIPDRFRFSGEVVILVDHDSGSAAELFSGIMQGAGRASIMGRNTAGKVFLKSMYPFEDGSMLLLVTARGYHPDGSVFSYDGVSPDVSVDDEEVLQAAVRYLQARLDGGDDGGG